MTGGDGTVSPPAPLHGGTGRISGFSAATGGAGGGDVGRSMRRGKELALASGSSPAPVGPPPPTSKSLRGREVDASGVHRCRLCWKSFKSQNAINGHMHIHKNRPSRGFSAATGGAGGSNVRRRMRRGKELALASGSSPATVGPPPPPSKSLRGREVDVEGSKKKRKKAVLDASGVHRCSLCGKSFKSQNAVNGHMHIHKNRPRRLEEPLKQQVHEKQDEEHRSILPKLWHGTFHEMEGRETKGEGSAVAEGGASSSPAAEAQRKKIHEELDLNKKAFEDDENDDEEVA